MQSPGRSAAWILASWIVSLAVMTALHWKVNGGVENPTAATSILVFVLDGYYSGAPGTVGRALFSTAGPLLALSAAALLLLDAAEPFKPPGPESCTSTC